MTSFVVWLFRVILLLYPGQFRRGFGDFMVQAFEDQLSHARISGRQGDFRRTAVAGLTDLLKNAVLERFTVHDPLKPSTHQVWNIASAVSGGGGYGQATWHQMLPQQVREALRIFHRRPGFSATVVFTLAVGIAANATMFGVVDRLLLRPPSGVVDPEEIHRVQMEFIRPSGTSRSGSLNYATLLDVDNATGAEAAGYFRMGLPLDRGPDAQEVRGSFVTSRYFQILGTRARLGRLLGPADSTEPVVVISHGFWRSRLAGDSSAIGTKLLLGDREYTVVGVAPKGFVGLELSAVDLWLPLEGFVGDFYNPNWNHPELARRSYWLRVLARISPTTPREQVGLVATQRMMQGLEEIDSFLLKRDVELSLSFAPIHRAKGPFGLGGAEISLWLMGVAVIVLLVCLANVANLMVTRAIERQREIAVRLALGIPRRHLVGHLLAESLVLALVGGAAGVLLAHSASEVFHRTLVPHIAVEGSMVDGRVLAFTVAVTVIAGLLAAMLPALTVRSYRLAEAIKEASRDGSVSRGRLRNGLVVLQTALSVTLLIGAALFVVSLRKAQAEDLGHELDRVWVASFDGSAVGIAEQRSEEIYRQVAERLRLLAGVEAVSPVTSIPMYSARGADIKFPANPDFTLASRESPYWIGVSEDFFRATGLEILHGRSFTDNEVTDHSPVVILNRALAEAAWPGGNENPVGKCVEINNEGFCRTVVGVVATAKRRPGEESPMMQIYLPFSTEYRTAALMMRLPLNATPENVVQRTFHEAAPNLPFVNVIPMTSYNDGNLAAWRLGATMFTIFGALALLIAAVGLYGVLAFNIAQRYHEIGVRMALGARPAVITRMVLRQSLTAAGLGVAVGLVIARLGSSRLQDHLFGIDAGDPAVAIAAGAVLLGAALLASLIPARRAVRVDPVSALRSE